MKLLVPAPAGQKAAFAGGVFLLPVAVLLESVYSWDVVDIEELRQLCNSKNIVLTEHARQRLVERTISIQDILQAIMTGRIIKQYGDDKPLPSCLILGMDGNRSPLHIVASRHGSHIYLITAYRPDSTQWEADWETRK